MGQARYPEWLAPFVRNGEIALGLHYEYDEDQAVTAYIVTSFLRYLGLRWKFAFVSDSGALPAGVLGLDTGGAGVFDGHHLDHSSSFVAAERTGFLKGTPWAEEFIRAVNQKDRAIGYSRLSATIAGLNAAMGHAYGASILDDQFDLERAARAALEEGLRQVEAILCEERVRVNAEKSFANDVAVIDLNATQQGLVAVIRTDFWKGGYLSALAQTRIKPRLTVRILYLKDRQGKVTGRLVSILSRDRGYLDLTPILVALRRAELTKRSLRVEGLDLSVSGKTVAFWFGASPENWLVSCATPKYPLPPEKQTILTDEEIIDLVIKNLPLCKIRPDHPKSKVAGKMKTE